MASLNEEQVGPSIIPEDNEAFLPLSKEEWRFLTSKQIGLRYHYLCEKFESGEIEMEYVSTYNKLADLLTKRLNPKRFDVFMKMIVFNRFKI